MRRLTGVTVIVKMSSSERNTTAKEKKEKEKKDKKEKEKSEKFDPNIDCEDGTSTCESETGPGTSTAGRHKNPEGSSSISEMQQFCNILTEGFKSVTDKLDQKLDDIGEKFGNSLNDLHASLDDRMTELADKGVDPGVNKEHESDVDMDNVSVSDFAFQHGRDHEMSESSSVTGNSANESFFKQKNKPRPKEKLGEKVDQDLADITNRSFSAPMSGDDFKKFKEKFVRPENVEWLSTPEVPFNIYRRLNSDFKDVDKRLKYIQEQLCPVAIAMTYALDKLGAKDYSGGMDTLTETLEGFGYVYRTEITEKRRTLLKPKLPEDFKVLASEKCPPTPANLLGNISENSKKISETEKLAAQMDRASNAKAQSARKNNNRDKPYSKPNSNNSNNSGGSNKSYFKKGYNNNNNNRHYDNKKNDNSRDSKNSGGGNSYFHKRNQRGK